MKKIMIIALALLSQVNIQAAEPTWMSVPTTTAAVEGNDPIEMIRFDNDGKTNVRNAPGGKVVDSIPEGGSYTLFIDKIQNGWCHIWKGETVEEEEGVTKKFKGATDFWIHSSVIGANGMGDGRVTLYSTPSKSSKVVYKSKEWTIIRPVEIKGKWLKVRVDGKKTEGWIRTDEICSNPLTNCC